MRHDEPVLPQPVAIAVGIGALLLALWAFQDAFEARGNERPAVVKLLPV